MTAPYRDDVEAMQARLASLEQQLADVTARRSELAALDQAKATLEREVEEIRRELLRTSAGKPLPLLESVRVASPCKASWDDMVGDDRVRFCGHCQKDVYNLSAIPRDEAEQFVRERAGDACIRLYRRTDGTVLTSDCPVGRRKRNGGLGAVAVGSGLLVASALAARGSTSETAASVLRKLGIEVDRTQGKPTSVEMGMMVMPTAPPSTTTDHPPTPRPKSSGMYWAHPKTSLTLFDSVGGGRVVGSVSGRDVVLVRRREGKWVLVSHHSGGRSIQGWAWEDAIESE